jgi:hypothetical protein
MCMRSPTCTFLFTTCMPSLTCTFPFTTCMPSLTCTFPFTSCVPSLTWAFDCFRYAWVFQNRFVFRIRLFDCFNFNVKLRFVASNYCVVGLIVTSCAYPSTFWEPYSATQPSCDVLPQVGSLAAALSMVVNLSFRAPPIEAVAAANFPFGNEAE